MFCIINKINIKIMIKNKIKVASVTALVALAPVMAFAQDVDSGTSTGLTTFLESIRGWMGQITSLLFAAAAMVFFWGLVKFIWQPEEKEKGKDLMIWGILAIFIMFSLWAIIKFLQTSTNTGGQDSITPPSIPYLPANTPGGAPTP